MSQNQGMGGAAKVLLGTTALAVTFVLGVAVGTRGQAATSPTLAPVAAAAAAVQPAPTQPPSGSQPPGAEPEAEEAPRPRPSPVLVTDGRTAASIAVMGPDARDGALCGLEAQADPTITFGLLDRSADRFAGHLWAFTGRAIQVQDIQGERGSFILVTLDSYGNNVVAVFTHVRPPDNVVANRRVRVWGRVAGTFSYETRAGGSRTVPKVFAVALIKNDEAPYCRRR